MGSAHIYWGYNDGLDHDPFLPVGQHNTVIIGPQLKGRCAKQAVTLYGRHLLSSEDDKTHLGRRLGSLLGRF